MSVAPQLGVALVARDAKSVAFACSALEPNFGVVVLSATIAA